MTKSNREPESSHRSAPDAQHETSTARREARPVPFGLDDDGRPHQRFPTMSLSDPAKLKAFAIEAARTLVDDKCTDVVCLDVRGLSQVSDYIVIGSGSSDRQMRSAGDDVDKLAERMDMGRFRRSEDERATWIVLDCIDVVVHIFEPNTRSHYDLEMLWGDAERVAWEREVTAGEGSGGSRRRGQSA